jgi:hypothetical protein
MDIVEIVRTILEIVGIFAGIATVTPNNHKWSWLNPILKAVNLAALNVGKAKNA